MATKLDYLRDLKDHASSTGGEAAARVDVPEATILEAYRRARRQGLIEGDGGRPERFTLTDAGLQQLRGLQNQGSEGSPTPKLPSNVEAKLSELEKKVSETIKNVKGLSSLVESVLSSKEPVPSSAEQYDDSEIVHDLLDEKKELENKLAKTARVIEFYATQIALAELMGDDALLEARSEGLTRELDSETRQAVHRLLELEEALGDELSRFFGPREDKVSKLQGEIGELRQKLGFAPLKLGTGRGKGNEEAE